MSAIGPGDVVVCVDARLRRCNGPTTEPFIRALVEGRAYTVTAVYPGHRTGLPVVNLAEIGFNRGFNAKRFRKIESDPALAEITTRIRNCRPVREKEPTNG